MQRKPIVTDWVHFFPTGRSLKLSPRAALITFVFEVIPGKEDHVTLKIFNPDGSTECASPVPFSPTPKHGCWSWPSRN